MAGVVRSTLRGGRRALLALALLVALFLISLLPDLFRGGSEAPDTGRVTTATGAAPPPGTAVTAWGEGPLGEVEAEVDGTFRFQPVPPGTVAFEAVRGPLRVRVAAGEGAVTLTLPSLAGRVVFDQTSEPVVGASVRSGAAVTTTDERGRFRLPGALPDGDLFPELELRPAGGEPHRIRPAPDAAWDDLFLRLPG